MAIDDSFADSGATQRCTDCGTTAPPTETNYTLISAQHGWRLSLSTGKDGRREAVWRCPTCWAAFRGRR